MDNKIKYYIRIINHDSGMKTVETLHLTGALTSCTEFPDNKCKYYSTYAPNVLNDYGWKSIFDYMKDNPRFFEVV